MDRQMKNKQQSAPALESIQMITDEYWDTVMMNTREKKEGPDGIKLWNMVYPHVKDYDQAQILVKELTDLKVNDIVKI